MNMPLSLDFMASGEDGKVKTFSRGGSDVTGSLVAKAIKADLYENWTDVPVPGNRPTYC